jgi:hypothetical protein
MNQPRPPGSKRFHSFAVVLLMSGPDAPRQERAGDGLACAQAVLRLAPTKAWPSRSILRDGHSRLSIFARIVIVEGRYPSARLPTVRGFPAMFFSVPPLMVLIPAMLPFSVQIPPPVFSLGAVLTLVADGLVEVCFRLFDRMLTLRSVFGVSLRRRRYKPCKSRGDQRCHCSPSKSSIQVFLLLS